MINIKEVITMHVPFPNISSGLAMKPHMYICIENNGIKKQFVKCQTLKPQMIGNPIFRNYIDERSDLTRNPFAHESRIDLDKTFNTSNSTYSTSLLTSSRTDVCNNLFSDIMQIINLNEHQIITVDEVDLKSLNPLIT